jgi:hypothetical protein
MTLLAQQPLSFFGPERMRLRIALPPMSRLKSSQISPTAKISGSVTTARPRYPMSSGGRNLRGVNDCRSSLSHTRSTPLRRKGRPCIASMKG